MDREFEIIIPRNEVNESYEVDEKFNEKDLLFIINLIKYYDIFHNVELLNDPEIYEQFYNIIIKTNGKILDELQYIYSQYHENKKQVTPQTCMLAITFKKQVGAAFKITPQHIAKAKSIASKAGKIAVKEAKPVGKSLGKGFVSAFKKDDERFNKQNDKYDVFHSIGKTSGKITKSASRFAKEQLDKKKEQIKIQNPELLQEIQSLPKNPFIINKT